MLNCEFGTGNARFAFQSCAFSSKTTVKSRNFGKRKLRYQAEAARAAGSAAWARRARRVGRETRRGRGNRGQVVRKQRRGNGPKICDFRELWAGKEGSEGRIWGPGSRKKALFCVPEG